MTNANLFKLGGIAGAVAAAFSGHALALAPAAFNVVPGDTLEVYIGGASAQDQGLIALSTRLCALNSMDFYQSGANQRAVFCTPNTTQLPGLSKTKLVIYKMSAGGSGNGVQPVADSTSLDFMDMATIKATPALCTAGSPVASVAPVAPDTIGLPAYNTWSCTSGSILSAVHAPDGGLSDVEPALLSATPTQVGKLDFKGANQLIFAIPATTGLRNALQTAQGLSAGADDEANMPSLTRSQINGIFTGQLATWDGLASNTGVALTNPDDVANTVYVVRRPNTSGSETITRVYFMNIPCAAGVADMIGSTSAEAAGLCGVNATFTGSGAGDVATCLNTLQVAKKWGIGLLSTEVSPTAAYGFRYIKIDGKAPTLLNMAETQYQFYAEQSMQWRKVLPIASDTYKVLNPIRTKLSDPVVIRALNSPFAQLYGQAGIMATPLNATPSSLPYTAANLLANPVNSTSKSVLGGLNNCQPPQVAAPTDTFKQ